MKTIQKAFVALGMAAAAVVPMMAAPTVLAADTDYYSPARGYQPGQEPNFASLNSVYGKTSTSANIIEDERKFVRIIDGDGKLVTDMTLQAGKEYTVYVFVRNDAKTNSESTIAKDVKLSVTFPSFIAKGDTGEVVGKITSSNASPNEIKANIKLKAAENMALQYKVNSAKLYNAYNALESSAIAVPDAMFTASGTLIGLTSLNGWIAGGAENAGSINFMLMTTAADAPVTTPNTGPTEVMIGIAFVLAVGGGVAGFTVSRRKASLLVQRARGRK